MSLKRKLVWKKNFLFLTGISLSLVFICPVAEAAAPDDNLYRQLSFNSIVSPSNLIDLDGIAFMCGAAEKSKTDTKTDKTTDKKDDKVKSGKKTVVDQTNSTSRRPPNIED